MRKRVLVADDEELERRALRLILGEDGPGGFEVVEASNGLEAIEVAGEGELDLAFLDIRMPGSDGIETARRIRELQPGLPIVFLTAHDRFEYARDALRLHVEDFLLKPASTEELLEAARRALEGRAPPPGSGSERLERTAVWLAGEIRAELAEGRIDGEKYRRWLALKGRDEGRDEGEDDGVEGGAGAFLAFRASRSAGGADPTSGLLFPRLEDAARLAERCLGPGTVLAGASREEGLCVWSVSGEIEGGKGEDAVLGCETFLRRARDELGFSLVGGLALALPGLPAPGEYLARAARRAAAVAGPGHPLVTLRGGSGSVEAGLLQTGKGEGPGRRVAFRALEIMDERHAENLSLEVAASAVGVSTSHLSRLLGRHFGLGFADCLARLRVERAKTLLAGDGISVKEVAALVGFHDPAYFSRVFRKASGSSPNEYRRLIFQVPAASGEPDRPRGPQGGTAMKSEEGTP